MSNKDKDRASSADEVFHHWLDPVWMGAGIVAAAGALLFSWRIFPVVMNIRPQEPDPLASMGLYAFALGGAIFWYTHEKARRQHPNNRQNLERL